MRQLEYPAVYRNFKNNYYATMGIAEVKEVDIHKLDLEKGYMKATHTETGDKLTIEKTKSGEYVITSHNEKYKNEKFALYKTLYDDSGLYVRPLEMFLSEVDKEKYPDAKQIYRFELVGY